MKILVPDIGDFKDVEVIDVLVKSGDVVALETPLITIETEKATMDVPSTAAGVIKSVAIKKGDRVSKGSVVVEVEADGPGARGEGSGSEAKPAAQSAAAPVSPPTSPQSPKQPEVAPSVVLAQTPSPTPQAHSYDFDLVVLGAD